MSPHAVAARAGTLARASVPNVAFGAPDVPKATFGTPGQPGRGRGRLWVDADGRVRHDIRPEELSNDLAGWLGDLVADGRLDPAAFEETFVAVVREIDPGWTAFYGNTLRALAAGGTAGGTNAGMAPVHDRAAHACHAELSAARVRIPVSRRSVASAGSSRGTRRVSWSNRPTPASHSSNSGAGRSPRTCRATRASW